jgi:hypothetical protein
VLQVELGCEEVASAPGRGGPQDVIAGGEVLEARVAFGVHRSGHNELWAVQKKLHPGHGLAVGPDNLHQQGAGLIAAEDELLRDGRDLELEGIRQEAVFAPSQGESAVKQGVGLIKGFGDLAAFIGLQLPEFLLHFTSDGA